MAAENTKMVPKRRTNSDLNIPRSVQFTMLAAAVLGLLFVQPYFGTILFSALIAFIFNPVYKAVLRKTKRQGLALVATLLTAFLSILLPLALVVGVTVAQANTLLSQIESQNVTIGAAQVDSAIEQGTERVNHILQALPGGESLNIDTDEAKETLRKLGSEAVQALVNVIKAAGGALGSFVTIFILAIFLIIAMLRYQDELITFIRNISPFHHEVTNMYLHRAGAMTKGMVKGQFIIAISQGLASAMSLWIVGLDYFWFFFMLLTFLSFIPLGGGILTIPIGAVFILTGNFVQGVFIILFHLVVVTNIDNILRPRLVPKSVQLNSALVLLSVFSGIAVFGAAGVIYGPVVMILLVATYQMYAAYSKDLERPQLPKASAKNA